MKTYPDLRTHYIPLNHHTVSSLTFPAGPALPFPCLDHDCLLVTILSYASYR